MGDWSVMLILGLVLISLGCLAFWRFEGLVRAVWRLNGLNPVLAASANRLRISRWFAVLLAVSLVLFGASAVLLR